jgi:arylsulfatase A-like enzyme
LAGVPLPTDRKIDGANILAVLTGKSKKSPHEFLYYYNGSNLQAVRQGKWKLHLPRTIADQPFWAKAGNPTVKPMLVLKENVLFDLEADIGEKSDVAAQNPAVVAQLLKEAERIRGELGDVRIVGTDQRPTWPPAKAN